MHWIAPAEKDAANDTLEKCRWADPECHAELVEASLSFPIPVGLHPSVFICAEPRLVQLGSQPFHARWVLVATNRFDEAGDAAFLLKQMEGRQAERSGAEFDETPHAVLRWQTPTRRFPVGNPKLPGDRDYWPDKTHLAWHRVNTFASPPNTRCKSNDQPCESAQTSSTIRL
ncbi:MAG: hypothetical protein PCFJNLEI_01979 [Verrucomicrobiae bacterium]|nr:hypothetical protein [Verrucomicrobiae bacterium]